MIKLLSRCFMQPSRKSTAIVLSLSLFLSICSFVYGSLIAYVSQEINLWLWMKIALSTIMICFIIDGFPGNIEENAPYFVSYMILLLLYIVYDALEIIGFFLWPDWYNTIREERIAFTIRRNEFIASSVLIFLRLYFFLIVYNYYTSTREANKSKPPLVRK